MEAGSSVYFGGQITDGRYVKFVWYRVDTDSLSQDDCNVVESNNDDKVKKRKKVDLLSHRPMGHWVYYKKKLKPYIKKEVHRVKLNIAAEMNYGISGCCTLIGEHIYWFGDHRWSGLPTTVDLFKRDINETHPLSWSILSKTKGVFYPGDSTAVIPAGRKLYVFGETGMDDRARPEWFGVVYDLDCNTWEDLICSIPLPARSSYRPPFVALVENKDGAPEDILFYSFRERSFLFFNITRGEWRIDRKHGSFALQNQRHTPLGLGDDSGRVESLIRASQVGRAILSDYTLYWFTSDLHLYGYDIHLRRWLCSPFLGQKFPTLWTSNPHCDDQYGLTPFLVDLRNGKFMLIVSEGHGKLTVASLSVSKDGNSLNVTVGSSLPLSVDHASFYPMPELSMLKNTWSGTMCGPVESARET